MPTLTKEVREEVLYAAALAHVLFPLGVLACTSPLVMTGKISIGAFVVAMLALFAAMGTFPLMFRTRDEDDPRAGLACAICLAAAACTWLVLPGDSAATAVFLLIPAFGSAAVALMLRWVRPR